MAQSSNQQEISRDGGALREAERATRQLAKSHYENFLVASVLLPHRIRQSFYNVYAFCRTADDIADESPSPGVALQKLEHLQQQLDLVFQGCPEEPLFIALESTVRQHGIPKQPFDDLLDAFRQDQHRNRYESFAELADYCCRSANPVGRIVLHLGDSFTDENGGFSDRICTGLQLANFWQDVARDFELGRIYVPREEMCRFGVDEAMFGQAVTAQPLRRLLASECDRAESLLREGLPLAERVSPWLSSDVKLFAHGGLRTLRAIRGIDYDVLSSRPTVGKLQQAVLVLRAFFGWL